MPHVIENAGFNVGGSNRSGQAKRLRCTFVQHSHAPTELDVAPMLERVENKRTDCGSVRLKASDVFDERIDARGEVVARGDEPPVADRVV